MTCIVDLLEDAAKGIESQLKPQLAGFFGSVVRAYLPQRWVFVTEEGAATLGVETSGAVIVRAGGDPAPDVLVTTTHEKLAAALRSRRREGLPPGPLTVTPRTSKGKTAFDFARRRLGL